MSPYEIIEKQQALLEDCKEEFLAALHHDSLNDYIVEKLINRIDSVSQEIKSGNRTICN